jgi:hypothetical protein
MTTIITWTREAETQLEEAVESSEAVLQSWVEVHQVEVEIVEGAEQTALAVHLFEVLNVKTRR